MTGNKQQFVLNVLLQLVIVLGQILFKYNNELISILIEWNNNNNNGKRQSKEHSFFWFISTLNDLIHYKSDWMFINY